MAWIHSAGGGEEGIVILIDVGVRGNLFGSETVGNEAPLHGSDIRQVQSVGARIPATPTLLINSLSE